MRKFSEGAEAVIYITKMLGKEAILKERNAKVYRVRELDEKLRMRRTSTEARIQSMLYENGVRVPGVILAGRYSIVMEKVSGTTLNVYSEKRGKTNPKSMLNAIEEAGRILGVIHTLGVSHGDFTTANLMLDRRGKLWVIDFGLSAFTDSDEERALDVLLMKRSIDINAYERFVEGYRTVLKDKTTRILHKLAEIEKRGRYQVRTLTAI